jgi:hypothetical protein
MLRSGLALLFLSSELCFLLEIGSFAPIPNMFEFVILRCYVVFFTESWGLCPLLKKKGKTNNCHMCVTPPSHNIR